MAIGTAFMIQVESFSRAAMPYMHLSYGVCKTGNLLAIGAHHLEITWLNPMSCDNCILYLILLRRSRVSWCKLANGETAI